MRKLEVKFMRSTMIFLFPLKVMQFYFKKVIKDDIWIKEID